MESQTELGKLREKKDKRDGARGAVTEQRWSTHTMLAHTCAHSVFFLLFFCPWNAHIQKKNGRRDYSLLVPCFYSSTLRFFLLLLLQTHTLVLTASSSSPSFSLKNKKYCCTCREAALSAFSLFFFTPLVQRAVNCDRCWKDVSKRLREGFRRRGWGDERDERRRERGCRDGGPYGGQRE